MNMARTLALAAVLLPGSVFALTPERLATEIEEIESEGIASYCTASAPGSSQKYCLFSVSWLVARRHVRANSDYYASLAYSRVPDNLPADQRYGKAYEQIESIIASISNHWLKTGELPVVPKR